MQIRGKRGKPSRYTVEDVQGMERMQRAGFRLQDIAAKYQCAVSTACEFINNAEEIMTHPNKRRGNDLEREIVNLATERGLPAKRAWGSNGKALGEHETVDLLLAGLKIQAKRRKSIATFLQVPEACDAVVFRQDRKPAMVLMSLERLFELLKKECDDGEKAS